MLYLFAKAGFSMLAAAFLCSFLRVDIIAVLALFFAASGVFCLCFFKKRYASVLLFSAFLGCVLIGKELLFSYYPAMALDGMKAEISGTVREVSAAGGNPIYTVDTDYIGISEAPQNIRIKVSGWEDNSAKPFDKISCEVIFTSYSEKPGEEFFSNRADGVSVYAYTETPFEVTGKERSSAAYYIHLIREKISFIIYEYFVDWHAPFMEQLLIGTRGELDYGISSSFRKSGMSHILAISGMHMAVIIFFIEKLLRPLVKKEVISTLWKDAVLFIVTLLYMFIGGLGASVMRSGIMLMTHFAVKIFFRNSKAPDNLGIAAALMLFADPMVCCDASFIMSAVSSLCLAIFAEPFAEYIVKIMRFEDPMGFAAKFSDAAAVSITAFLSVLPVSVIYFGEVSLLAPVSNIFAGVFAELSLVFGAVTVVLGLIPFLEFFAGGTAFLSMLSNRALLEIADFFSFARVEAGSDWIYIWIIGSVFLLAGFALYSKSLRYVPVSLGLSAAFFAAGIFSWFVFYHGVTIIDISATEHGTAVSCSKDGCHALITHGLGTNDRFGLRLDDGGYDYIICLNSVSGAAESDIISVSEPDFAMLTFEDVAERHEHTMTFAEGTLRIWEGAEIEIISESVFCAEFDEISLLYISEKFDIMDIEPKFRRAEIIILDGVSPEDYPALRCEYMILRDMGGFYSGSSELITLIEGNAEFSACGSSVLKGLF